MQVALESVVALRRPDRTGEMRGESDESELGTGEGTGEDQTGRDA